MVKKLNTYGKLNHFRGYIMSGKDSIWCIIGVLYILPIVIGIAIAIGVQVYVDLIPKNQTEILIGAFLTASSILFGFTSSSIFHFLNKIMEIKRRTSDVAKEFCDLYRQIEDNPELSEKDLAYYTRIHTWGIDSGYGANETARHTIQNAYEFLIWTFGWLVDTRAKIIYIVHGLALVMLGSSMVCGLLSYASVLAETTLFLSVNSFMISIPMLGFGWSVSQRFLTQLDDTIFVVRQQIHGGLRDILPYNFQPRERA